MKIERIYCYTLNFVLSFLFICTRIAWSFHLIMHFIIHFTVLFRDPDGWSIKSIWFYQCLWKASIFLDLSITCKWSKRWLFASNSLFTIHLYHFHSSVYFGINVKSKSLNLMTFVAKFIFIICIFSFLFSLPSYIKS